MDDWGSLFNVRQKLALIVFAEQVRLAHELMVTEGIEPEFAKAVATYLASKRNVDKLILVTPFDSAVNVGKKLYRFFPIGLILQERLDAASMAAKVTGDTLIIAAADDRIVPHENTYNLARAFTKNRVEVETLIDTGHNTVHLHPEYKKIISEFMR